MPNKALRHGYDPAPFFFRDPHYEGGRLIAWTADWEQQRRVFRKFAEAIGKQVDYLYKELVKVDDNGLPVWLRIHGEILLDRLFEVIDADPEFFFSDGTFQFCMKDPETSDNFAYDDHGIFWIYAESLSFQRILQEEGFVSRREEVIYMGGHWHYRPKDAEERIALFKERLIASSFHCEMEE